MKTRIHTSLPGLLLVSCASLLPTVSAANPPPKRDVIVGYRLAPPQPTQPIWFPYHRTAGTWRVAIDTPNIVNFGWTAITDVYLADFNGDGLDDKVMRQTVTGDPISPSQLIVAFTGNSPTGFTAGNFAAPDGDVQTPFGSFDAAGTEYVFGDVDDDGIDDIVMCLDVSRVNSALSDRLCWGGYKSNGVPGIPVNQGGGVNFTNWSVFGVLSAGDKPAMGDFNGDGVADRLLHRTSSNQIFIDLGVPGGFGNNVADYQKSLGVTGDRVAVSDLNGDGLDDLVLVRDSISTVYGFYNDGQGFATVNGAAPSLQTTFAPGDGVLFGYVTERPLIITELTAVGPDVDFAATFQAPASGTYRCLASTDLLSWQETGTVAVAAPGLVPFTITQPELDSALGSAPRPNLFIRIAQDDP